MSFTGITTSLPLSSAITKPVAEKQQQQSHVSMHVLQYKDDRINYNSLINGILTTFCEVVVICLQHNFGFICKIKWRILSIPEPIQCHWSTWRFWSSVTFNKFGIATSEVRTWWSWLKSFESTITKLCYGILISRIFCFGYEKGTIKKGECTTPGHFNKLHSQ